MNYAKKVRLSLLLGALSLLSPAYAQDYTATLTTSKAVGEEITIAVNRVYGGVLVDWGDGTFETVSTPDALTEITGTVKGEHIVVGGSKAWKLLIAAGQQLTALDVTKATQLQSLYVQNNALTALTLTGMTALTDLDVSGNALKQFTFGTSSAGREFASIECLNIAGNAFTAAQNYTTATLQALDVSGNDISTLTTASNTALDFLRLDGNKVRSLDLSKNTQISTIVASDNALTRLIVPTSELTTVQQLIADNNKIRSDFDLSECASLSDVSLANNQISTLYVSRTAQLSSMNISGNKLTFASLPLGTRKPAQLTFMPQETVDISGYENVLTTSAGVPYMPVTTWAARLTGMLSLDGIARVGATPSIAGTAEGDIEWKAVAEDGTETTLTAQTSSSGDGDFFTRNRTFAFFKPHHLAYAVIRANHSYADAGLSITTTAISIGEDEATGIGSINADAESGLSISAARNTLTLSASAPTAVKVYASDGRNVWNGTVSGTTVVALPAGAYLVNGKKVLL